MTTGRADRRSPWRRILARPTTRLGWWSVGAAACFAALFLVHFVVLGPWEPGAAWLRTVVPVLSLGMLACGLAAGVVGAIAVIRRRERSWLVWLGLLPGLMVLAFLLGEILVPH